MFKPPAASVPSMDAQAAAPPVAGIGVTYAGYLRLEELLDVQTPLSSTHDELLFIVIHQTSELWMKLCLHELDAARALIGEDDLAPALKMMARVSRIQEQLIQSWGVLATMTPKDYSAMRGALGTSSGFQSSQYRRLEFVMGARNPRMLATQESDAAREALRRELATPSLYDAALALLARRGFDLPLDCYERDFAEPRVASPAVAAAWGAVYRDAERHWDLYDLAEKLVDLESRFQQWRFGHLKAVERIIGFKPGTGGSPGVPYLAAVLGQVFFPELLDVRKML